MAKNQKSYTPEFKQQIVDLYNTGETSYPKLEREYGINRSTPSSWVKQLTPVKVSETETVTLKEFKEEGWTDLVSVMDLCSRKIIGYAYKRQKVLSFTVIWGASIPVRHSRDL